MKSIGRAYNDATPHSSRPSLGQNHLNRPLPSGLIVPCHKAHSPLSSLGNLEVEICVQVAHGNAGHLQRREGSHMADKRKSTSESSSSEASASASHSDECFLELWQRAWYPVVGWKRFLRGGVDLAEAAGSPEGDTCGRAVCRSQGTAILSAGVLKGS